MTTAPNSTVALNASSRMSLQKMTLIKAILAIVMFLLIFLFTFLPIFLVRRMKSSWSTASSSSCSSNKKRPKKLNNNDNTHQFDQASASAAAVVETNTTDESNVNFVEQGGDGIHRKRQARISKRSFQIWISRLTCFSGGLFLSVGKSSITNNLYCSVNCNFCFLRQL